MRPIGTVLIVLVTVFVGGALLAPWLYWSAQMSTDLSPWFAELARQPFHRFVHRALLGLAIPGLWLIAWQNGLTSWRDLGMRRSPLAARQFAGGAVLGFVSLASVGLLALAFDARRWNSDLSLSLLGGSVVSAMATALLVSTLEEILFRGALFGGLRRGRQWATALVGSSAVVPNRRWAATMAVMPSGLGSSLNRTSPPPFTWTSMNPGASQAPSGSRRTGMFLGNSRSGTIAAMRSPSITTARSCRTDSPSKRVSAASACRLAALIGCA